MIKFCSHKDIDLAIQILKKTIDNTEGQHSGLVIKAPINRVIFELEELKKQDIKELIK
jgi:hypothetical protein